LPVAIEAVDTAIEGHQRLMARHFRHQAGNFVLGDVGRIADDEIEAAAQSLGPVAEGELRAFGQAER